MKNLLLTCLLFVTACGGNETILRSGKETPTQASTAPHDVFADDLMSMRTAGFTWVYVLRRMDGGKIDAEDRGVIRVNTVDTNRRVSSDEDRAIIIGTNPAIPPDNMKALYARFAIVDHSPPPDANANTNSNANANK